MRVKIKPDNNENWLKWGKLVNEWIDDPESAPRTVGALRDLLDARGIGAEVEGRPERRVTVQMYARPDPENPDVEIPLQIHLPSPEMRNKRLADDVGPGRYKLPLFYDTFFEGGVIRAMLSAEEAHDHAFMRIGEYTVNECC